MSLEMLCFRNLVIFNMASSYQANVKRQKVRDSRGFDNIDYFQGVDKVEYRRMSSMSDNLVYRYYNQAERVHGRSMEEWLKISVSLTNFKYKGCDKYGQQTYQRTWSDDSNSVENYKKQIKACFDFCQKLGVKYWTAFDSDLIPIGIQDEFKNNVDEIVEFIQENIQRTQVKLLWIAPDLHSSPKYASGAFTSHDTNIFAQAAVQTKKCIEIGQKLNAENILIWPHREGYSTIINTDISRELKLFFKQLKMIADYKEKISFRGQLLIMACDDNDAVNRYVWNLESSLCFLKHYNLERFYKICVEPGHSVFMAQVYNMLGGVHIDDRDGSKYINCHNKGLTLMMKTLIEQSSTIPAGIHLSLKPNRDSVDIKDMLFTYVGYIDKLAKCLRAAADIISEQLFSKNIQHRYTTFYSGLGARLLSADVSFEECDDYVKKHTTTTELQSSKCEHWGIVLQRYIDSCDHV